MQIQKFTVLNSSCLDESCDLAPDKFYLISGTTGEGRMVGIEEYRARIGRFRCRGTSDEGEKEDITQGAYGAEALRQLLANLGPGERMSEQLANLVIKMSEVDIIDVNHPSVIEAKLVIGNVEVNPGPGMQSSCLLVSLLI
jgi:hypothetical protein